MGDITIIYNTFYNECAIMYWLCMFGDVTRTHCAVCAESKTAAQHTNTCTTTHTHTHTKFISWELDLEHTSTDFWFGSSFENSTWSHFHLTPKTRQNFRKPSRHGLIACPFSAHLLFTESQAAVWIEMKSLKALSYQSLAQICTQTNVLAACYFYRFPPSTCH